MLKILQIALQQYVNQELLDIQDAFWKCRGTRDQIANVCWIIEKAREFRKNICFIDYAKAFDCVNHNKWWKVPKEMWIPEQVTCLQEICMQVNKQQLELDMEQWAGSKMGNVNVKAVYYHTTYLTFMQSISCEMLCWMKHRYNSSSVFLI